LTANQNTLLDGLAPTLTATELNYVDGVTSPIQTQLNRKLETVTVTGDATGSGTTTIALTLSNTTVTAGSYGSATTTPTFAVDAKGRLTAAGTVVVTPAWTSITSKPTTIAGYGITDVLSKNGDTLNGTLLVTTGNKISLSDAPVTGTDAVNKNYVDAAIAGLSWKNSVKVASSSNIALSGTQTIDGVAVVAGDRVLVMGQTAASENGIYVVADSAWARSSDADTQAEIAGLGVWVQQGTVYGDTGWTCTNNTGFALGTDPIVLVQFNGAAGITAGTGLIKTGNTLSIGLGAGITQLPTSEVGVDLYPSTSGLILTQDGSTSTTNSAAQLSLSNTGVAAGTYTSVTVDVKGRVTSGTNPTTLTGLTSVTATTFNGALSGNATTATTASNVSGTVAIANGGTGATLAEDACTNIGASRINPTTPKDGDIKIAAGPTISVYATGAWRQVFPAVYS
jgi:phage-related tail fiber protein